MPKKVGIYPNLIELENGSGNIELEDSEGVIELESAPEPTLVPRNRNLALNSITPAFQFVGLMNSSSYGRSLEYDDITPPYMQYISSISSVTGGTLVYCVGTQQIVNSLTMDPGKDYFVAWPLSTTTIWPLDTPTEDWQGTPVTNDIIDLVFKGN